MTDNDIRRTRRRSFLKASGAGAVALSLAGCSTDDSPDEDEGDDGGDETEASTPSRVDDDEEVPRGGSFGLGISQAPPGLNPLATSSAYAWAILDLVYETGTMLDPVTQSDVRPWVYTDWTVEDPDSDAPDVLFDVREGLTFTDGEELTVEDVVFTYDYLMEQQPGRYAAVVSPIESVEPDDGDWDVRMRFEEPRGNYETAQLAVPILPKHRWEGVDNFREHQPTEHDGPVGLGPGEVTQYRPETSIELTFRDPEEYRLTSLDWVEEHENLRSGGPFLDSVRYSVYGSSSALQEAFISEDAVDAIHGSILPSRVEDVAEKEGARFVRGPDTGYNYYSFNMRRTPLDDTIFRQALGMAYDSFFWTEQLLRGLAERGTFVMPPAFRSSRPDGDTDEINEHPATKAFDFRDEGDGALLAEEVKEFLRNGEPIHGAAGTYAGFDYPGSLTGVEADETEARHEYSWGPVESDVLEDAGVEEEIRVDGQTFEEFHGGPLRLLMYPPQDSPLSNQMADDVVENLREIGIPVRREVMTFNTMLNEVFRDVEFDVHPMSWTNLDPFAAESLYGLFHSDQAHGEDSDHETQLNNPMGYGLPGLPGADERIEELVREVDADRRSELARETVEKIYLDFPTQVNSYDLPHWPVNDRDFGGYVDGIPTPGSSYVDWQFRVVHRRAE